MNDKYQKRASAERTRAKGVVCQNAGECDSKEGNKKASPGPGSERLQNKKQREGVSRWPSAVDAKYHHLFLQKRSALDMVLALTVRVFEEQPSGCKLVHSCFVILCSAVDKVNHIIEQALRTAPHAGRVFRCRPADELGGGATQTRYVAYFLAIKNNCAVCVQLLHHVFVQGDVRLLSNEDKARAILARVEVCVVGREVLQAVPFVLGRQ